MRRIHGLVVLTAAFLASGCAGSQGSSIVPPAGVAHSVLDADGPSGPSDWKVDVHFNAHGETTRQAYVYAISTCYTIQGSGVWIKSGQDAYVSGVPECTGDTKPEVATIEVSIAPEWLQYSCFLKIEQRGDHTVYSVKYKNDPNESDRCRFNERSDGIVDLYYSF